MELEDLPTAEYKCEPNPLIGTRLGDYEIVGLVAEGGMGTVFRAKQTSVGREVAIKFLPAEMSDDETSVKRMEREAKVLGSLTHNNIVKTFDFGFTKQGQPYIVMELLDGKNLKEILLEEKMLEPLRATKLFIQIADAMRCAHAQGVIHRDIKPQNVMIVGKGTRETAKILDFGIAKLIESSQKLTRVGEICGSPFYMSPEQCTAGDVDVRSDIYSLGVIMYHTFTGELPIKGDSFPETVRVKVTQDPLPFKDVCPGLKKFLPELERTVLKCLRRSPNERHSSMMELKEDLEWCLSKLPPDTKTLYEEPKPAILQTKQKPILPPPKNSKFDNERAKVRSQVTVLVIVSALALMSLGSFFAGSVLNKSQPPSKSVAPAVAPTAPANVPSSASITAPIAPPKTSVTAPAIAPATSTAPTTAPTTSATTAPNTAPISVPSTPTNPPASTTTSAPTTATTTVPTTTTTSAPTTVPTTASTPTKIPSHATQTKKTTKKTVVAQVKKQKPAGASKHSSEPSMDDLLIRKHSFGQDPNHFYHKF